MNFNTTGSNIDQTTLSFPPFNSDTNSESKKLNDYLLRLEILRHKFANEHSQYMQKIEQKQFLSCEDIRLNLEQSNQTHREIEKVEREIHSLMVKIQNSDRLPTL